MRPAGNRLVQMLVENPHLQDIVETALMAGGSAAYQGLFTDLTAEEIARNTAVGTVLGLGGRFGGAAIGRAIGKNIDARMPGAFDEYARYFPATRDGSAATLKLMRKGHGSNTPVARGVAKALEAKRHMSGAEQGAGTAEAIISFGLRNRMDNILQGSYALLSPMMSGGEEDAQ